MSLELRVIDGPDQGRKFTLNVGPAMMLGRSDQAQYQLTDPRVSRNHCQVEVRGQQVLVTDLQSAAGTFVNVDPQPVLDTAGRLAGSGGKK